MRYAEEAQQKLVGRIVASASTQDGSYLGETECVRTLLEAGAQVENVVGCPVTCDSYVLSGLDESPLQGPMSKRDLLTRVEFRA